MAIDYLYNSGLYGSDWEEGPHDPAIDNFSVFDEPTYLQLLGSGAFTERATLKTVGPVNLTDWLELKYSYDYFASDNSLGTESFFGLATSGTAVKSTDFVDYYTSYSMTTSSQNAIETISISGFNGNYYLYFGLYTNGKPGTTTLNLNYVRLSGDIEPPVDNYGTVGVENTPELYLYVDGIYSLAAATGQVGSSIGNMTSNSTAYSNNDYYGFVNNYQLDGLGFITDNQLTILGSVTYNIKDLTGVSIIGASSGNFGAAYGNSLDGLGITSSGYFNLPLAGHVLTSLNDTVTINTSGGDYGSPGTSGHFKYTSEWQRFIGRACNIVKLESSVNKLTTSCFSMLKSNPVTIYPTDKSHTICKCDCTANIPIFLNRKSTEDVDLVFRTKQGISNINYEDKEYIPAVVGSGFYSASGEMTIPSGHMYGNFPVDIINDSGNLNDTYFKIELLRNTSNNICYTDYSFNVLIEDCTDKCLYRWIYTSGSDWTELDWELITDGCLSGTATPPFSSGTYVGEEKYGTCVI